MRVLVLAVVALAAPAAAATATIPIHQAEMPNGTRYSISLRIGGTDVDVMLDTGSAGLYVLPGTLTAADAKATSADFKQSYGSGVELQGVIANAKLSLDGVTGSSDIGLVQDVHCVEDKPNCAASHGNLADYRIGSGKPGAGFKAIFGINFRHTRAGNPLVAMGIKSWIVTLPKPGSNEPGTLTLDPASDERAAYRLFHVDRERSWLPGCLLKDSDKVCGGVVLDSGAPGISVVAAQRPESFPWPNGAKLTLALKPDEGEALGLGFEIERAPLSPTFLRTEPQPNARQVVIRAGTLPYFAYSVLYDYTENSIGLKAR